MAKLKDLKVTIGLSKKGLTKLNSDLRSTKANFRRNFGQIQAMAQNMGRNLSVGVTAPLGIMAVQSVKAFDTQAKAIAQVEAGLKSTGAQVGFTSQELQKMASDLQTKTLFGDEVILKDATAQLLTFTNIAGDQFGRTQKAALDLATRLDGDLKSASIQLGKALNDPIANLSALSRSGIQFSAEQKETIKALAETNQLADAQTIILDELEKQYGGSAEAAAQAGTGGLKQLQNSIGDLQEEFGKLLVDILPPIIDKVKQAVQFFSSLSDRTKKLMLIVGAFAASAGPLMMMVSGFMSLAPVLATVGTAIGGVLIAINPLNIAIAAMVGTLAILGHAIKNKHVKRLNELEQAARRADMAYDGLNKTLSNEFAQKSTADLKKELEALNKELDKNKEVVQEASAGADLYARLNADKADQINKSSVAIKKQTGANEDQIEVQKDLQEIEQKRLLIQKELERRKKKKPSKKGAGDTEELIQMERSRINLLGNLNQLQTDAAVNTLAAVEANKTLKGSYTDLSASLEPVMGRFNQLANFAKDQLPGFFQGAFQSLTEGTKSFGEFMMDTLKQLLIRLTAMAATFAALSILFPGSTAIAGGFGKFMAGGMGIPQMADGGLFTGASLAMVGEGPGTSAINPEVVAPLDKLQQMMGGGNVTVTGRLDGRDILLSSERSNLDRNRVRGF